MIVKATRMGSGKLFKSIISLKKRKDDQSEKAERKSRNSSTPAAINVLTEDAAATRIQTAFRAFKARKTLRRLKGIIKVQTLTQKPSVKKQATTALQYLHRWDGIQAQIRARRMCMVSQSRLKQKMLESQQKLEAKLHDVEVEWNNGSESKEDILARIHNREEASAKRERAMAYAFSHQWRANGNYQCLGNYEPGKTNWGWSWKDRWITGRPWELRYSNNSVGQKKNPNKMVTKTVKSVHSNTPETSIPLETPESHGRRGGAGRRSSFPGAENPRSRERRTGTDHKYNNRTRVAVS